MPYILIPSGQPGKDAAGGRPVEPGSTIAFPVPFLPPLGRTDYMILRFTRVIGAHFETGTTLTLPVPPAPD